MQESNEKILISRKCRKSIAIRITIILSFIIGIGFHILSIGFCYASTGYDFPYEIDTYFEYYFEDLYGIFHIIGVLLYALALFMYLQGRKNSITVTDRRIFGIASFGKKVVIPIKSITKAEFTRFGTIIVYTESHSYKFRNIRNKDNVIETINSLISSVTPTADTNDQPVHHEPSPRDVTLQQEILPPDTANEVSSDYLHSTVNLPEDTALSPTPDVIKSSPDTTTDSDIPETVSVYDEDM